MNLFNRLKQVHTMYYVSLLYLVFPLYSSLSGFYPLYLFPMTVMFALGYISLVIIEHPLWLGICWSYLCLYIIVVTFMGNHINSMFCFFLSNLLTWRFQTDKLASFRYCTFYLVLLSTVYPILVYGDLPTQIFLLTMDIICLGMMYSMKQSLKRAEIEKELMDKNISINLLLAENERNRIGQDLHDTLGHVFAMMSVKSELALTLMDRGSYQKARQEVQDLHDIAKHSMQEVRQIVQALKTHSLEEELRIISNMLELAGISLSIEKEEVVLNREQEATLTMALRELCNNLIKHSKARTCRIELTEKDGWIQVFVEDDGVGFEQVTGEELHSIRDRLIRYQGRVEIVSDYQPTQIQLLIPKGEKDEHTSR